MSTTHVPFTASDSAALLAGHEPADWTSLLRRLLSHLESRKVPALAAGEDAVGRHAAAMEPILRDLETICLHARFMQQYPDMPSDHRHEFLLRIIRCSTAAKTVLDRRTAG